MKVFKCPMCPNTKTAPRRQKTCSRKCGQALAKQLYGEDFHKRAFKKLGEQSAKTRRRRMVKKFAEQAPGVPPDVAKKLHAMGYNSGWRAGYDSGYRRGWSEALGEKWKHLQTGKSCAPMQTKRRGART